MSEEQGAEASETEEAGGERLPVATPKLSVIVLTWNALSETKRCVASIRANTDVPYELVIVDNGSATEAADFAGRAADLAVMNPANLGFAPGMNQGLASARGEFIAFCNNDIRVPPKWASTLLSSFEAHPNAGIVIPAVTAAGNPRTVRSEPGDTTEVLLPFGEFPSGVLYVMRTSRSLELGGWCEEYPVASSEDLDLCFTVWANGLDLVFDQRVLVEHTSQATVVTLPDRVALYRANLALFLDKWSSPNPNVPRLSDCSQQQLAANLGRAATAIQWIRRTLDARERAGLAERELVALRRELDQASRQSGVSTSRAPVTRTGRLRNRLSSLRSERRD